MRSRMLLDVISLLARIAVWCSGGAMLLVAVMISMEILSRRMFGMHLVAADEISGYALAITTSWAISFTLLQRGHIRVDAFYMILPKGVQAVLDLLALLAMTVFAATLSWYALDMWANSWELQSTSNTPLATPLWIPQGLWVIGLLFFLITNLALLLRATVLLVFGHVSEALRITGTRSLEDALQEQLESQRGTGRQDSGR